MRKRRWLVVAGIAALAASGIIWFARTRGVRATNGAATSTTTQVGAGATSAPGAGSNRPMGAASMDGGKVTLSPEVAQALVEFARKAWKNVPLAADKNPRTRGIMRGIASAAIDLEHARSRMSSRFLRTSYTQDVKSDAPIYLGDRWGPDGRPTARRDAAAKPLAEPMRTVYREGADGTTFGLAKMKEQTTAGAGLEASAASQQAKGFFVENGLLAESTADRIEPGEVRERRISSEAPSGGAEKDVLAQQDILLRRTYEDKLVVNSRASVGVLPDSGEVVEIRLERWTAVDAAGETTTKAPSSEGEARSTATLLEEKLRRQIELDLGTALVSAQVEHVEEAWFQTDTGLIPVLVFVVRVVVAGEEGPRNLVVAINPGGDDSLIWDQGRIVREPAEPSEAP